jgi:uroporphyrinogen decarboxylase
MTSRELVLNTLILKSCERTPWVPFVGVHGASLIGEKSSDYLRSKQLIVKGVTAAIENYKPDGIPVIFDLQLEAEALGCSVVWADDNPPSVVGHPLALGESIDNLVLPQLNHGRVGVVMETTRELRLLYPDIALYGLVTGPFTLALHLLGTDIFMKLFMDEQYVHDLMRFCTEVAKTMSRYYLDAGCDVIAVVDPMVSQIGTEQFEQFVLPYATEIFDYIRTEDGLSSLFVCGDAQHNIDSMCRCRPDNISVDENISLSYVKQRCLQNGISFGGNLKLTSTLLLGTEQECEKDAAECMDTGGNLGYIVSPGCDLPYATKIENLKAVSEVVLDQYRLNVVRAISEFNMSCAQSDDISSGEDLVSVYKENRYLTVDVITLDSGACAPCQYMMSAVLNASEQFGDGVRVVEHKIKTSEGLKMMRVLNVKKIPTICIDGETIFSSVIPAADELKEVIFKKLGNKQRE